MATAHTKGRDLPCRSLPHLFSSEVLVTCEDWSSAKGAVLSFASLARVDPVNYRASVNDWKNLVRIKEQSDHVFPECAPRFPPAASLAGDVLPHPRGKKRRQKLFTVEISQTTPVCTCYSSITEKSVAGPNPHLRLPCPRPRSRPTASRAPPSPPPSSRALL
jgi:hypothetical protein